jgi:hypothetical protein
MGHPYSVRPGAQAFLKLMWSNYAKKYPPEKTVGFSFNHAHAPGTTESLRVFEDSGVWPGAISVDVYQEPERFLGALAKALAAFKRPDQPVVINETYRNNKEMAAAFGKAKKQHAINFRFLLQWPLDKGSAGHCDNPLSAEIDAYLRATLPVSE